MLTYEQSLQFIHSIARFGSKPGLRRVKLLLERMGNPQDKLRFIHVAGTDGKGSTCTMLSSVYTGAGYRTGLYISPFVIDFRERIQLNGEMIPPEELAQSTTTVKQHWDALDAAGETPTEFEVVVAVAMDYFVRMQCDLVVLEVGMGGRFDATNIIGTPLCSVITHISLDHMEYLGNTIEQIAFEKCGIIKRGGVTVSYPFQHPAALSTIQQRCAEEGNELHIAHTAEAMCSDLSGNSFRYENIAYHVPFIGKHQIFNALTAIETVKAVSPQGFPVQGDQLARGIAASRFPSRVELMGSGPRMILDGGHNPAEAAALAQALALLPAGCKVHAVIGMLADKDVDSCLAQVLPHCASLIAVTPDYPRAMAAETLAQLARRYCPDVQVSADKRAALTQALARCRKEDTLLACGSLYLASELRPILLELAGKSAIS